MIFFQNDYGVSATKEIIDNIAKDSLIPDLGYGEDKHTINAVNLIKQAINKQDVDIHFLVGGTQTNICAISVLRPYEAVISCDTGHINVHECGSIEHIGHKIITIPNNKGKIDPNLLVEKIEEFSSFHMVEPKMVYLSNSTELGTIYTKAELEEIRSICDKYNLYLFLDGARLAQALTAEDNDLTLPDIAKLCDIFYIGGTKNGALFGEALVICNDDLKQNFKYLMKQTGAVLAKGKLLGIQFETLFTDNLYYKLGKIANEKAMKLKKVLLDNNIKLYLDTTTNQLFPIVDKDLYDKLSKDVQFELQFIDGNNYVIRFVTSFATTDEDIVEFEKLLKKYI